MTPRGRRPGGGDTRGEILAAARREFTAQGYDRTSLRGIARVAGVDPRLVHHYFDGKAALFAEVIALPVQPSTIVQQIAGGPLDTVGERLARTFFGVWDDPEGRQRFGALLRSVATHEGAARMVREFVGRELFGRLVAMIDDRLRRDAGAPPATARERRVLEQRAGLAAAQVIGLAFLRYLARHQPVVDASVDELVALIGPTLQRYLVEEARLELVAPGGGEE